MSVAPFGTATLVLLASACISPSVVDSADRAVALDSAALTWSVADGSDVPGTYVSTELAGSLASVLRLVVYRFEPDGAYTGAALLDDDPPHFEVVTGTWALEEGSLRLDAGPPAALEVAQDGSLRLTGAEGTVVLRRERAR